MFNEKTTHWEEKLRTKVGIIANCGCKLSEFENNKLVANFLCPNCKEEFKLRSKNSKSIVNKIVDGAYHTMIERINFV